MLRLPERLGQHWLTEIGAEGRPAARFARSALAEDLQAAVEGLGIRAKGLRKPELVDRLSAALTSWLQECELRPSIDRRLSIICDRTHLCGR